jgi:general secretion pathway protein I
MKGQAGFSLIEIMVALLVFSIASMAFLGLTQAHLRRTERLETRILAQIEAENRLRIMAAYAQLSHTMPPDENRAAVVILGRSLRVQTDIAPTDDPDIVAVSVKIAPSDGDGSVIYALEGFQERPRQP